MRHAVLAPLVLVHLLALPLAAAAQPIERVKITDADMNCQQMFDELGAMDKVIAETRTAQAEGQTTATAGQAAGVAAEVASRTGLFGSLGGLGGHIFGTVASKTAANVAEQSGQQSAAQAMERQKQAGARKEHVTAMFVARGCSASDPSAPPRNPNAAVPMPAPASSLAPKPTEQVLKEAEAGLAPLAGEMALKNDIGGVLRGAQRVFVPQFRVAFVAKSSVSAHGGAGLANVGNTGAGYRTVTQGQSQRIDLMLGNVDMAMMQGIAERLHADFIARLKAAGKEVVSDAAMRESAGFRKIEFLPRDKPYVKSPMGDPREYIVVSPRALPLAFLHIDSNLGNAGPFDQNTTKALHEAAANLDAVALIPTLVIDFAELESSGRSNYRSGAHAEATPRVNLGVGTMLMALSGKDAKIFFTGDFGIARLNAPFFVDGDFAEMKPVDSFDNVALANSLTLATGLQGTQYRYEKRVVNADPARFAGKALQVGATANLAFARSMVN